MVARVKIKDTTVQNPLETSEGKKLNLKSALSVMVLKMILHSESVTTSVDGCVVRLVVMEFC